MSFTEIVKEWRRRRWLVRALVATGVAFGVPLLCNRNEYFRVGISVSPNLQAGRVRDVSLVLGPEKSSWHELRAGKTVGVTLFPGRDEIPVLSLSYLLRGSRHTHVARDYVFGAGYRTLLSIDEEGAVSETKCQRPCSLAGTSFWDW